VAHGFSRAIPTLSPPGVGADDDDEHGRRDGGVRDDVRAAGGRARSTYTTAAASSARATIVATSPERDEVFASWAGWYFASVVAVPHL